MPGTQDINRRLGQDRFDRYLHCPTADQSFRRIFATGHIKVQYLRRFFLYYFHGGFPNAGFGAAAAYRTQYSPIISNQHLSPFGPWCRAFHSDNAGHSTNIAVIFDPDYFFIDVFHIIDLPFTIRKRRYRFPKISYRYTRLLLLYQSTIDKGNFSCYCTKYS